MSTVMKRSSLQDAERRIMEDLINAFLAEQLLPLEGHPFIELSTSPEPFRRMVLGDGNGGPSQSGWGTGNGTDGNVAGKDKQDENGAGRHSGQLMLHQKGILFLVKAGKRQGYQWVQGSPVYGETPDGGWKLLESPAVVGQAVLRMTLSDEAYAHPGVAEFLAGVKIATEQLALGLQQVQRLRERVPFHAYDWFIKGEQVAALRDRPFHPTSKAKVGFTEADVTRYAAEFRKEIPLRWVAVRWDAVQQGCEEGMSTLDVLDEEQRSRLEAELARKGLNLQEYMPMPVHPWQMEHIILPRFNGEIADGTIVVLDIELGEVQATSSLRSMAPMEESTQMLKLPVSVLSLGAARYLPVVKLLNGLAGEKMLRQAVACDESLTGKVWLCEERNWWGYMPESMGLFDDHPRHLAAQIRIYPPKLLEEGVQVIPMAALGVTLEGRHMLSDLLGRELTSEEVIGFYTNLTVLFYDVVMRLFKVGVVPEIHGQNCCVVLRNGRVNGLLFRDHDSVRLHQPYLDKHGIADPGYHIRPGYSNSLYNETIRKLIFYVQSLGTQVNLAAIMEALSEVYPIPEAKLWDITEQAWKEALRVVPLPEADRAELFQAVFESREWPMKLIIRPLLEADGVPGAMPSGKGTGHNPFYKG
ncbi:IucA/IucC family protein [Paenibacillus sp. DRB1-1]|uniref:IucA/IucC family protein n=1 Tax=Paenibacillus sp. DRB1-1 TaxID=3422309 RepID=UPI003F96F164